MLHSAGSAAKQTNQDESPAKERFGANKDSSLDVAVSKLSDHFQNILFIILLVINRFFFSWPMGGAAFSGNHRSNSSKSTELFKQIIALLEFKFQENTICFFHCCCLFVCVCVWLIHLWRNSIIKCYLELFFHNNSHHYCGYSYLLKYKTWTVI